MIMKKVSIIVPMYKSEPFIEKLIKSVLSQSYNNFELILVDDGSPDNSGLIGDRYAKRDNRITVIHKKNGGTCEARNVGLNEATGEYLMFADGDDWFASDCVEYLVWLVESNDVDMAMSDCVFTTRNLSQNENDFIRVLTPEEAACFILYAKTPIGPWNKLYKREIINNSKLSFSVPWFGEGLYFSCMAAQYANKVAVGHRKVYVYRMNNSNSGTTVSNVQHGINALNNIVYIKNNLVINTAKTRNATDWHIWNNNYNLIIYITGARARATYIREYKSALKYIRKMFIPVLLCSDISFSKKVVITVKTAFPVLSAKFIIGRRNRKFRNDKTE